MVRKQTPHRKIFIVRIEFKYFYKKLKKSLKIKTKDVKVRIGFVLTKNILHFVKGQEKRKSVSLVTESW